MVCVRIESANTAKENARLEKEIARLEREEMHLSSVIANLERPENLKMLLAELGSGMAPVSPERQIRLDQNDMLPDFGTVRVSTNAPVYQVGASRAAPRPVFIRE